MGASQSNELVNQTDITTSSFSSCAGPVSSNKLELENISFRPDLNPACNDVNTKWSVTQSATAESDCIISSLQDTTADTISKLDAETQAGLGYTYSNNKNDILTQINSKVENQCKGASSEQEASLKDITVTACQFEVIQDANLKSACTINTLQNIANQASNVVNAENKATSLLELLFGSGTSWLILIIVIIIIIIIAYMFSGSSSSTTSTTSTTSPYAGFNAPGAEASPYSASMYGLAPASVSSTTTVAPAPSYGAPAGPIPGEATLPAAATTYGTTETLASTNPFATLTGGGNLTRTMIGGAVGIACSLGPILVLGILALIALTLYFNKKKPMEQFQQMAQMFEPIYTNDIPQQAPYGEQNVTYSQPGFNKFSQVYQEAYRNDSFFRPDWAEKYLIVKDNVISVYLKNSGQLIAQAPRRYRYEQNGVYFNLLGDGSEIVSDMWGIIGTVPAPFVNNDKYHDYENWQDYYEQI